MFFKPSRDNMTTKELLNEIMSLGNFECLEDKNRNLYILYNEKNLLVSPGIQALRIKFLKNPNEKQVDCN